MVNSLLFCYYEAFCVRYIIKRFSDYSEDVRKVHKISNLRLFINYVFSYLIYGCSVKEFFLYISKEESFKKFEKFTPRNWCGCKYNSSIEDYSSLMSMTNVYLNLCADAEEAE